MDPGTLQENILYCTVKIEQLDANGNTIGTGTGFFFQHPLNEKACLDVVLTNRHVVQNCAGLAFRVHEGAYENGRLKPKGESLTAKVSSETIVNHPDANVDLAAIKFGSLANDLAEKGRYFFRRVLTESDIADDEHVKAYTGPASDVLMVGYPKGIYDDVNNLPIVRRGITASHPATDFRGKSTGLIDIACFPGSSGSPVIHHMEGAYRGPEGETVIGGQKTILLGILSQRFSYEDHGEVKIQGVPTSPQAYAEISRNMNLGLYIKAKEIMTLMNHIKSMEGY